MQRWLVNWSAKVLICIDFKWLALILTETRYPFSTSMVACLIGPIHLLCAFNSFMMDYWLRLQSILNSTPASFPSCYNGVVVDFVLIYCMVRWDTYFPFSLSLVPCVCDLACILHVPLMRNWDRTGVRSRVLNQQLCKHMGQGSSDTQTDISPHHHTSLVEHLLWTVPWRKSFQIEMKAVFWSQPYPLNHSTVI